MSAIIPEELVEFIESGISTCIGTRDADRAPAVARACGTFVHSDRRHATVFVSEKTAAETLANLRDNGEIAICHARPVDHRAIQLKGRCIDVRPSADSEHARLDAYRAAFVEQLYNVGLPRSLAARLGNWPSFAITYEVIEIFAQTPGPGAGAKLGAPR